MTQPQQPELRRSGGAPTNDENLDVMPDTPSGTSASGAPARHGQGEQGRREGRRSAAGPAAAASRVTLRGEPVPTEEAGTGSRR
ncbi:hypothetical protein [Planomonospora algeriensis]